MTASPKRNSSAFTLIELLVVIGIIAVIAGLVVGLGAVANEKSRISRAQAERDRLVTLIENYKSKIGVYPPDNRRDAGRNTLLYELGGAVRNPPPNDPDYVTPFGTIRSNLLRSAFEAGGIINASDDGTDITRLLKELKPDQVASVVANTLSLVVPIDDSRRQRPNPWKYLVGNNAIRNTASFDLWVEIYAAGKTNSICTNCIVIGNWKD